MADVSGSGAPWACRVNQDGDTEASLGIEISGREKAQSLVLSSG